MTEKPTWSNNGQSVYQNDLYLINADDDKLFIRNDCCWRFTLFLSSPKAILSGYQEATISSHFYA